MGDMADWVNDQLYDPFIDGPEVFPYNPEDGMNVPAGIGCKYCLAGPLYWIETAQGWRLADDQGQIHSCEQYRKAS